MTRPVPQHPQPRWWDDLQDTPDGHWPQAYDLCSSCGHVRWRHRKEGCSSPSSGLFDARECDCSNRPTGCAYKVPAVLVQP